MAAYKRLGSRWRGLTLTPTEHLWLADDHLLTVTKTGYSESYQRYYFSDIQLLTLRRTGLFHVFSGLCIAVLLLASGIYASVHELIPALFLGLPALLVLLANLWRGPTCACHIQTAVQQQRLTSLVRVRSARRSLTELATAVRSVQGDPDAGLVAAAVEAARGARPAKPGAKPAPLSHHYDGSVHGVVYGLTAMLAAGMIGQLFWNNLAMVAGLFVVNVLLLLAAVVALVKQSGSALPKTQKRLVWGLLLFGFVEGMIEYFVMTIETLDAAKDPISPYTDMFTYMAGLDILASSVWLPIYLVSIAVYTVLVVWGTSSLLHYRRYRRPPVPSAAVEPPPLTLPTGGD